MKHDEDINILVWYAISSSVVLRLQVSCFAADAAADADADDDAAEISEAEAQSRVMIA